MMEHPVQAPNRTRELEVTEESFRLLVDGIKDYAIFLLDGSGHVVTWNAGARALKGYEAHEIVGRHFSCFYEKEDIARRTPQQLLQRAERDALQAGTLRALSP